MRWVFTCSHFQRQVPKQIPMPAPRALQVKVVARETGRDGKATDHSLTEQKVVVAKARTKEGKVQTSFPASFLDATTLEQILMDVAFASTIRWASAVKHRMEVSALEGGICAAERVASHHMQRRTTMTKRSD